MRHFVLIATLLFTGSLTPSLQAEERAMRPFDVTGTATGFRFLRTWNT